MSKVDNKPASGEMNKPRKEAPKPAHRGPGALGIPAEKASDFKGTFKRLLKYLRPRRTQFIIVLIFAILSTTFSIVGPKIMGRATDEIFNGFSVNMTEDVQAEIQGIMMEDWELIQGAGLTLEELQALGQMEDGTPSSEAMEALQEKMPAETMEKLQDVMLDNSKFNIDMQAVGEILLLVLGLYLISALFTYIMQYVMASVAQKTVYEMREEVSAKFERLPLKYYDGRTHGEILSRVTNDLDNISNTLQQSLTQLITAVVTLIGSIVMMLSISGWLTLVALVTLPISAVVTMGVAKRSQKYFKDQQKVLGNLNGHIEEMYTGHKVVKAFTYEEQSLKDFDKDNEKLYEAGWKAQFMSGIVMPAMNFINNIGYVLICVVGGVMASNGSISVGSIQAFFQYSRQFGQPIVQTASIANIIQSTIASAERVFEVLDEQEQVPDKEDSMIIENAEGLVEFKHIKFGYTEDNTLMKDIDIHVKPGQTVAIVGPTGAGKTTLVNLLMRFYEVDDGQITIDGIKTTDIKRGDLRNMFGMVLQDTWLFNGSIKDNIAYGNANATFEDVVEAAKLAHADHFIRTLPEGYETILNEEASNISQGQKQLLTIARAILANPQLLILDEATSSVDTRTEVLIQNAMNNLMAGRTNFVIAHRLSTIKDADLILVMNHGDIIEQGTHSSLLEADGFYADLYNSQFAYKNVAV